ncbi:MAG TPA: aspartate/glutamate racemase family protein, partial [Sphingomonadales bacterium]|nr:aspartate/glutamate racemase family protein [Sphingomonadales bacterium]
PRNVAVFATPKTVDSGAYPHQVRLRAPKFQVIQQPCPGLVGAIEAGEPEEKLSAMIEGYCQKLAKQMVGEKLDAVFLGCTHYPLVENLFRKFLPEGVEILDQPEIAAAALKTYLEKHPEFKTQGSGETLYFTTGKPIDVRPLGNLLAENNIKFQEISG